MQLKEDLIKVVSLPNENKYGLYYGKLCIFSDKSLESVDEQRAYLLKYGIRAYRLIGDFYAMIGNNKEYFAWLDLHVLLKKFVALDGEIENDAMAAASIVKYQRKILPTHIENIKVYYTS